MTLKELALEFEAKYMITRLRPSTIRGYQTNIEKHTLPYLAHKNIEDISVDDLDALTTTLKRKLSNKSIVYVHATLRKMLNFAIKRGFLEKTPYDSFDLPRIDKYQYKVLDTESIKRLLTISKGTDLEIPIILALCYGLRRGECLGIIPAKDLDHNAKVLHIQRTRSIEHGEEVVTPCKTEKSNRLVLLSAEHSDLLFHVPNPKEYACQLTIYQVDMKFKKLLKDNGFPAIRFHDLRHSYATFMLSQGVNPKIVSTVLGHSTVSITLDIYSHPNVNMQSVCLQAFSTI